MIVYCSQHAHTGMLPFKLPRTEFSRFIECTDRHIDGHDWIDSKCPETFAAGFEFLIWLSVTATAKRLSKVPQVLNFLIIPSNENKFEDWNYRFLPLDTQKDVKTRKTR